MNSKDFINKHLTNDINLNFNMNLEKHIYVYEKYTTYLKLLRNKSVIKILTELKENKTIFKALLLNSMSSNNVRYYLNILNAEGIIESTEPSEELLENVVNYMGSGNANKTTFYKLSVKGLDFLENKTIKKYFEEMEE